MSQLIECVPNFSEGRDRNKIERIVECFRGKPGVKLLDYSADSHHNRLVVTAVGERRRLKETILESTATAIELIDMRVHTGRHPRMGAVDVVPFIPVREAHMEECVDLSAEVAEEMASRFGLPVYLYEKSARTPERALLSDIREGEFEGLASKMAGERWKPDFGPAIPHPTAGAVAIGARNPIVAFNVKFATRKTDIAQAIVRKAEANADSSKLRFLCVDIPEEEAVKITVNMTDFTSKALHRVFDTMKFEAHRWGVPITGSEIVGMVPTSLLADAAEHYLGLKNFSMSQVLESRLMEE